MADNQIAMALTTLAERLGTTSEYLWTILVRQALLTGIIELVQWLMFLVATYGFYRLTRRVWSFLMADDMDIDYQVLVAVGIVFGWLALLIVWIVFVSNLPLLLSAFIHPEYWALQQVLSALGK